MPPVGATTTSAEVTNARSAKPLQKKSPSGTSTAGASAPSQ